MTADPSLQAELEDQRNFLLRSLEDLEREHDAGDVDDADYAALKDDYTHRAAVAIRSIESEATVARRPRRVASSRRVLVAAAVVAFAVLSGWLIAQSAGRRDAGEVATGDVRQSVTEKLNEAGRRGSEQDYEAAVELYDEVLADDPDNAEAAAYRGWMLYLSGDQEAALEALLAVATASPEYPDVHAFLAVVFFRSGLLDPASRELDRLDGLNPSAGIRQLTDPLREQLESARSTTATTAAGS